MRILLITDLEGVNGVLDFPNFCVPAGRRNEQSCIFLTEEVNAAAAGFFRSGIDEVIVFDGHGSGGSVRSELLDKRAFLQRGCLEYPLIYTQTDAIAFVGQHAKAGTANAHLAHTQTEEAIDFRINGKSIGEFGQLVYSYGGIDIPAVFAAGDLALTHEARDLVPEIFTVAVKEGFNAPQGAETSADELFAHESAALHYPRELVLKNIQEQAALAGSQLLRDPGFFSIAKLDGKTFIAEAEYRRVSAKLRAVVGDLPPRKIKTALHSTVAGAVKEFYTLREWAAPDGEFVVEA